MKINKLLITITFILFQRNIISAQPSISKEYKIYKYIRDGNIEEVEKLLDQGIDVNLKDGILKPPLVVATAYDDDQVMLYFLLRRGANVFAKCDLSGLDVLETAKLWNLQNHIDLINAWIAYLKICKKHFILKNSLLISSSIKELIPELSKIISEYSFPFDDITFPKYIYQHPDEFPKFEYNIQSV